MNFTYEPLTQKQIEDIHQATLDVLEKCGVEMCDERALEIFKKHGATIDGNIVKIPPSVVNECMKIAPKSFILDAANPDRSVNIGASDRPLIAPNATSPFIIDDEFKRRNVTFDDMRNFFKLSQSSSCVDIGGQLILFPTDNCTYKEGVLTALYEYFIHMDKPMNLCSVDRNTIDMTLELMHLLTEKEGGYPMFASLSPISPLQFNDELLDGLFYAAEKNQVMEVTPCSAAGLTGPITGVDNVVLTNAENVAMFTLIQLINPGLPVVYSTYTCVTDMRTLQLCTGASESIKMCAMARQMAGYYEVPFDMPSGSTDAKNVDVQAALETTTAVMNAFGSKVDIAMFMLGSLDSFNSASYRKFILDEEIIKHVQALIKPAKDMNISKTVDLITEVGQHGTYVKHKNTLRNYRKEHSFPDFGVRTTYEEYVNDNMDMNDRIDKQLKKRMDSYVYPEIPEEKKIRMKAIYEKYLK
ncbi:MAG: trimethylamine methyltransferase family protein [Eubacterium sp.]